MARARHARNLGPHFCIAAMDEEASATMILRMLFLTVLAVGVATGLHLNRAHAEETSERAEEVFVPDAETIQPTIAWRIQNPFRFFTDPRDTSVHQKIWQSLSVEERENEILAAERILATRHKRGWAADLRAPPCWDTKTNAHKCKGGGTSYLSPQSHRVVVSLTNLPDPDTVACTWSTAPLGGKSLRGEVREAPCSKPVTLKVPYPDGARVNVEIGGRKVAASEILVQDLLIVGMGDSFASGEGNPDMPVKFSRDRGMDYKGIGAKGNLSGYPARVGPWREIADKAFIKSNAKWLDQACHRSMYSHQLRAALQIAIEDPHRVVTYAGFGCSGAEVTSGLFLKYKGHEWVPNPPALSQISAAANAQCGENKATPRDLPEAYHIKGSIEPLKGLVLHKCPRTKARKIDLLLLSIGGNDIGFARMLANAILADKTYLKSLGGWMGHVHGQSAASAALATLDERYKALNRAFHNILHIPWRESDRVILTGYPNMDLLGDGSKTCPGGTAGMDLISVFKMNKARARSGVWVADKLHRKMRASAKRHGWTFVEGHRSKFIGHGICAGFVDDSFSIADDLRLPRRKNGAWTPYNPADYRPYAARSRWFRTPNDAFLTGNFHVTPVLLRKVFGVKANSWFQLVLAATYSGAFHPTAEGQAVIADAVVKRARVVLEKYKSKHDHAANASSQ